MGQLTLQQLKSHLWNCAEILRGSAVDRTDWKAYILPLLFFKRICDVWDEETSEAAKLFGDADPVDFPEVHRFIVPEGCHWREVRETPANIGAALSRAMREIERANPDTLYRQPLGSSLKPLSTLGPRFVRGCGGLQPEPRTLEMARAGAPGARGLETRTGPGRRCASCRVRG